MLDIHLAQKAKQEAVHVSACELRQLLPDVLGWSLDMLTSLRTSLTLTNHSSHVNASNKILLLHK